MTDHSEHTSLEELKEKVEEVFELLNQSNLPVIVTENDAEQSLEATESCKTA
jgi:hypothetical protein